MLRLVLMRHATAAPASTDDMARALTFGGRDEAAAAGKALLQAGVLPDLALVSPAARTRETAVLVGGAFEPPFPRRQDDGLYDADAGAIGALVRATVAARTVLVIGHNPGLAEAVGRLTGSGDRYALARLRSAFPPASFAVLDFNETAWADVAWESGRLERFVTPGRAD